MTVSLPTLSESLKSAQVFVDGDWVESKDQDPDGDVRLVQLADVGDGVYLDKSSRFLTSTKAKELRCTFLEAGDILVARMPDPLGRACIFPGDERACVTVVDVCIIRPDPEIHDPRWLMHCLNSSGARNQIAGYATGTTRSRISRSNLGKVKVPLPSAEEQRRIAEVLDRADELRAKRRQGLAHLDDLTQSIFLDMFGDLCHNNRGWELSSFGLMGRNEDARRVPVRSSDREDQDGPYPYYGASGIIDYVDDYIFDGARLLVAEDGANLLARPTPVAFIASGQYWVNNHAHVIAENGVADLQYLEFVIKNIDLKPYISGSAQPKLNRANLDRIPIPLPPLPLQREFADRVSAIDKLKAAHRASLAELDGLFASLQDRAFKGLL